MSRCKQKKIKMDEMKEECKEKKEIKLRMMRNYYWNFR
jgi:predicted solute-binding protein